MMPLSVEQLERHFYDRRSGWIDGTRQFHELCRTVSAPGGTILEIGAGPTNPTSAYLATLGRLHGCDPDASVRDNDALVSASVMETSALPFSDASFDACVSNYVVEHVDDPRAHLREVARVLKPSGAYVFRTPNRWHYVALVSSLTPHWAHRLLANRLRALPADSHDPYPTHYALNSARAVRRHAARAGLVVERIDAVEKEPSYARFSRVVFLLFVGYERLVNATSLLAGFRANLFVVLRKPDTARGGSA